MIISKSKQAIASQITKNALGPLASWLIVFVFVFCSLRGWAVLNLNLPTELVYGSSSLLLISLALYGVKCRFKASDGGMSGLRSLLVINALMGIYYILGTVLLGGHLEISILYVYLLPYIVFLFVRVAVDKLHTGLFLIFVGISFSVIDNFRISLNGVDGLLYLEDYNTRLRPLIFAAMSRTGDYLRVGGYTGSYHDSANILGMLGSFYYISSIVNRSMKHIIIAMIAFVAMAITQSAANIVIALLISFIFTVYIIAKKFTIRLLLLLLCITFILILITSTFPHVLVFTNRLGAEGDWEGMGNKLGLEVLITSSFWLGFGYSTGSEFIETEIGFLKAILQQGIISATLLFWILIYPGYIFLRKKSQSFKLLPYLAAIIFGFSSLVHYGSLFRVTNIAIFYAMYALFFINVIVESHDISET